MIPTLDGLKCYREGFYWGHYDKMNRLHGVTTCQENPYTGGKADWWNFGYSDALRMDAKERFVIKRKF